MKRECDYFEASVTVSGQKLKCVAAPVAGEGQRNLKYFLSLCQRDETALTLHTLAHRAGDWAYLHLEVLHNIGKV